MAVSLVASLFSISNKYTWLDKDGVVENAREPEFKRRCPCINGWYVLRIIWRFSFVATRFCVLSLVWSVLGGEFLGIFLAISFCLWNCSFLFSLKVSDEHFNGEDYVILTTLWAMASLISTPTTTNWIFICIHGWEMILSLTVITIFAYNEFECSICADSDERQANNNPYIA